MKQYRVENSAGVIFGFYKAVNKAGALDALARDAGYADREAAAAAVGPFDGKVTEIRVWVTLDSDGMGEADEADFDSYCDFVEANIDDRVDFEVDVDRAPYGQPGTDGPGGYDDEAVEAVREALQELWNEWCAEGAK